MQEPVRSVTYGLIFVEIYKKLTATKLVRFVAAIVREVADLRTIDALLVRALVLHYRIAGSNPLGTHRQVVLVRTVAAIVDSVTELVARNATVIRALESSQGVAREVR